VQDTVALNVAFGLVATDKADTLADGLDLARQTLSSGVGNAKLDAYLAAARSPQ
jgi:anthranilate phosphoribosyltransferase